MKEIGIEKRNGDDFLTDADGNKIEFVLNTNIGNGPREKAAVLIASDLEKLGMQVIFQPIEFNTLIDRTGQYFTITSACCMAMGGDSTDPAFNMNVLKSSGFSHEWFPRQKTPSTDWEARIDHLMDAQLKTLDFAERKKDFDEVQKILAEQQPMIFTVVPVVLCRRAHGHRQPAPDIVERFPRHLERRGALFQKVSLTGSSSPAGTQSKIQASPASAPPPRPEVRAPAEFAAQE